MFHNTATIRCGLLGARGNSLIFFRTPSLKSQKKSHKNHKITRKITYRKKQKSQITRKLLKNHTKKSLEITKKTKNHRKKSCDFKITKITYAILRSDLPLAWGGGWHYALLFFLSFLSFIFLIINSSFLYHFIFCSIKNFNIHGSFDVATNSTSLLCFPSIYEKTRMEKLKALQSFEVETNEKNK